MREIEDPESFGLGFMAAFLFVSALILLSQTVAFVVIDPTTAEVASFFTAPLVSLQQLYVGMLAVGILALWVLWQAHRSESE